LGERGPLKFSNETKKNPPERKREKRDFQGGTASSNEPNLQKLKGGNAERRRWLFDKTPPPEEKGEISSKKPSPIRKKRIKAPVGGKCVSYHLGGNALLRNTSSGERFLGGGSEKRKREGHYLGPATCQEKVAIIMEKRKKNVAWEPTILLEQGGTSIS